MLKNTYLDAKIGFDPAENEPSKVSWKHSAASAEKDGIRRLRGLEAADKPHHPGLRLAAEVQEPPRDSALALPSAPIRARRPLDCLPASTEDL